MGVQTTFEGSGASPGKYEIVRRLATGGMAQVDLARMCGLGGFERLVVIKRIRPELAGNPDYVRMFFREVRIAATLHHANLVQIIDVGMKDGEVFCVMEYLHGQNLSAVLGREQTRGQLVPLDVALAVVCRVCAGLDHAHRACDESGRPLGIVHRDITPDNVFATYDGNVKILDFGIARTADPAGGTRAGVVKGKPGFMSPEQCRSEPLDGRSDIFSAGVLLYVLTTGFQPWRAHTDWEYLKETCEGRPVPPREVRPAYSTELEALVLRAMAPRPEQRFPTAGAMLEALESFAARAGFGGSPTVIERYMASAFAGELGAWRAAQQDGRTLLEHVTAVTSDAPAVAVGGPLHRDGRDRPARWLSPARTVGALVVSVATLLGVLWWTRSRDAGPPRASVTTPARPAAALAATTPGPASQPVAAPAPARPDAGRSQPAASAGEVPPARAAARPRPHHRPAVHARTKKPAARPRADGKHQLERLDLESLLPR